MQGGTPPAAVEAEGAGDPRGGRSSPDVVVDAILEGIRSGRLVPGQRLVEADLTHSLGVSRGPVREALKRLAAEGLVTLSQNRGANVRALSLREASDLLQVLEVATGLLARLAAQRIGAGHLRAEFEATVERLLAFEGRGDTQPFLDMRRDFYDLMLRAAGNAELDRTMPRMQIHLLRLQFQTRITARDRRRQFDEYRLIAEAVRRGLARRAERLMRLHIRRTRLSISRMPPEAFDAARR